MAFARDKTPFFQNTHFTSISSQGNYRTDSPLQHDPQKRPNTAPEFFGEKLVSLPDLKFGVEKNLFDENEIDDETRFIDRTVSPIFTGQFMFISCFCLFPSCNHVSVIIVII